MAKKITPKLAKKATPEIKKEIEAEATVRFVRISPYKVKPVIDLIRGKNIPRALEILDQLPQRAAGIVTKLVKSAVANAKQKEKLEEGDLYIFQIFANDGVRWKRIRPRAMGRADRYLKRTAHITVIVRNKI